MNIVN